MLGDDENVMDMIHIYYTIGSFILCYELYIHAKKWLRDRKAVSWNEISQWVDALYKRVLTNQPDIIIGLGRGGSVVAGLIAAKFRDEVNLENKIIPIGHLDRIYLKDDNTVIVGLHNIDTFGKKVLLLNADSYSGNTLNLAKKLLSLDYTETEISNERPVQTGSLVILNDDSITISKPDHFGKVRSIRERDRILPWGRRQPRNIIADLPGPRIMVVLNGLVATGKTSVANALLKELRYIPIYSDWYWFTRGLHNRDKKHEVNVRHYKHMFSLTVSASASGKGTVLDTTSSIQEIRDYMQSNARRFGIRVIFIRCHCSKESSLNRIRLRKHIGPYDFGTEFEYDRVANLYENIDRDEQNKRNIISLDTDSLTFTDENILGDSNDDIDNEVVRIKQAIELHYLSRIRSIEQAMPDKKRNETIHH